MKIAIHERPDSFSDRWIDYCKENDIDFKIVNCNKSNIILQLANCDGLMWHWAHDDYRAQNFARQLILSLEKKGLKVFPNSNTCWHFDDKVGQKYLLESINAPLIPTHVFFDAKDAVDWISKTSFPKVFKLRGGAGSQNVKLVKNKVSARRLVKKAFTTGFSLIDKSAVLSERWWILKRDKNLNAIIYLIKGIAKLFFQKRGLNLLPLQKGYVYFQDFVPNNDFDDRIVIVGNRAIAIRRQNRKNDFRASGSGIIRHDANLFNRKAIKLAFDTAIDLKSQSMAFDIVYHKEEPKIVEISYAYSMGVAYDNCQGYWDKDLNRHDDNVNPQRYIIEDFISYLKSC